MKISDKNKIIIEWIMFIVVGLIIGVTGTLSFLRTSWASYQPDFFFWASIVSTILGFFFICVSIWQYWQGHSLEEKNKAQVKVWMQDANGIVTALKGITRAKYSTDKFSSINDVFYSVDAVSESASALYQSLYEERCVTETEYRARQKRKADLIEESELEKLKPKKEDNKSS
jgi:cadmium resistance protein CadD (predicted permease)